MKRDIYPGHREGAGGKHAPCRPHQRDSRQAVNEIEGRGSRATKFHGKSRLTDSRVIFHIPVIIYNQDICAHQANGEATRQHDGHKAAFLDIKGERDRYHTEEDDHRHLTESMTRQRIRPCRIGKRPEGNDCAGRHEPPSAVSHERETDAAGDRESEEGGETHTGGCDVAFGYATPWALAPRAVKTGFIIEIFIGEIGSNLSQDSKYHTKHGRHRLDATVKAGITHSGKHSGNGNGECAESHGLYPTSYHKR